MENFFSRYKNPLVLMAVLFIQFIALATQVKRAANPKATSADTPLIRVWAVNAITPVERVFVSTGRFFRNTWHNYIDLHNVRKQNLELQDQIARLKLEETRLKEDAGQAHRLQTLLDFKQNYVGDVLPAQVIGTSGSEHSRLIYIDKGERAGLRPDMAVITPDGIVGKVKDVTRFSSSVLLINDRESGAGVILEKSRRQGVLRGAAAGELNLSDIMSDEKIDVGESVVTSGGDRIYPKGVPVGTVSSVSPDREDGASLAIKIKPAVDLNRLEEVLVVTTVEQTPTYTAGSAPQRAADILAERLPSVPKVDPNAGKTPANKAAPAGQGTPAGPVKKPDAAAPAQKKPATEQKQEAKSPAEQKKIGAPDPTASPMKAVTGATPETGATPAPKPKPAATPAAAGVSQGTPAAAVQKPKPATPEQKKSAVEPRQESAAPGNTPAAKPKPAATPAAATAAQTTTGPAAQKSKPAAPTKKPVPKPDQPPATPPQPTEAAKPEGPPPAASPSERPPR